MSALGKYVNSGNKHGIPNQFNELRRRIAAMEVKTGKDAGVSGVEGSAEFDGEGIVTGDGTVKIDQTGINITVGATANNLIAYKFSDTDANNIGGMAAYSDPNATYNEVELNALPVAGYESGVNIGAYSPAGKQASVIISAKSNNSGPVVTLNAQANSVDVIGDVATNGEVTVGSFLNLSRATATIAAGAITATASMMVVDTQGGTATTSNLDTVNGYAVDRVVILRSANSARDVVVKDGTGNIHIAGDCTLGTTYDTLMLTGTSDGWAELSRSING